MQSVKKVLALKLQYQGEFVGEGYKRQEAREKEIRNYLGYNFNDLR